MPGPDYTYRCHIERVIDGDTVDARIDLGFHLTALLRIRLLGVDCPELRRGSDTNRAAGSQARDFTSTWIATRELPPVGETLTAPPPTWPFLITTAKADSFGRWLGKLSVASDSDEPSLNEALLEAGHATPWTRR